MDIAKNKPPKGTPSRRRYEICHSCEFLKFKKTLKICGQCGCCVVIKSMIKTEECPLGKWKDNQEDTVQ